MQINKPQPYRVYHVGGRSFLVYWEIDERTGESCPNYPDFELKPEYTSEGQPFATAAQESCPYARPKAGDKMPDDCGDCAWFYRDNSPYEPIGICMCKKRSLAEILKGGIKNEANA